MIQPGVTAIAGEQLLVSALLDDAALVEHDQAGGQIEREVQAREQYFRYEEDLQNALAGTLQSATTNNNGASDSGQSAAERLTVKLTVPALSLTETEPGLIE